MTGKKTSAIYKLLLGNDALRVEAVPCNASQYVRQDIWQYPTLWHKSCLSRTGQKIFLDWKSFNERKKGQQALPAKQIRKHWSQMHCSHCTDWDRAHKSESCRKFFLLPDFNLFFHDWNLPLLIIKIVNRKSFLQDSVCFHMIGTHHGITPDSGRLHAHHHHPLPPLSIPCFRRTFPVGRMVGKSLSSQWSLASLCRLLISLSSLPALTFNWRSSGIVWYRWMSGGLWWGPGAARGPIAGCGSARPDPHPWPAPPPERAARLPAVAPDKLISRDARGGGGGARPMGGGYKGQWLPTGQIRPPQQQPASNTCSRHSLASKAHTRTNSHSWKSSPYDRGILLDSNLITPRPFQWQIQVAVIQIWNPLMAHPWDQFSAVTECADECQSFYMIWINF